MAMTMNAHVCSGDWGAIASGEDTSNASAQEAALAEPEPASAARTKPASWGVDHDSGAGSLRPFR